MCHPAVGRVAVGVLFGNAGNLRGFGYLENDSVTGGPELVRHLLNHLWQTHNQTVLVPHPSAGIEGG